MLSNTATPKYYALFRDRVYRGEIPVNQEISMEMNRIENLIQNPMYYFDNDAVEGWVEFCEGEMTLTDGGDLKLLDSFKLWGEEILVGITMKPAPNSCRLIFQDNLVDM